MKQAQKMTRKSTEAARKKQSQEQLMNDGGSPSQASLSQKDSSMSQTSLQYLTSTAEPSMKRIKLETTPSQSSLGPPTLSFHNLGSYDSASALQSVDATATLGALKKQDSIGMMCRDDENDDPKTESEARAVVPSVEQAASRVATTVSSTDSLQQQSQGDSANTSPVPRVQSPSGEPKLTSDTSEAPLKVTKMSHLRSRYMQELEYMLCEFQKLERQLLGAKSATSESAGSRERREKLHSFILHLQETIDSIKNGCKLEAQGKSTVEGSAKEEIAQGAALADPSTEKEEEENVQKLEEHILSNLLPVKARLKKQLAAQQGAKHNPAGMPVGRRNLVAPSTNKAGTFAEAAELKRQAAVAVAQSPADPVDPKDTQFGKALQGTGSSLTKKLHGETLGSSSRLHGTGVGHEKDEEANQILYAGLAIGSEQVESSVSAATSVHRLVIQDRALLELAEDHKVSDTVDTSITPPLPTPSAEVGPATAALKNVAEPVVDPPAAPTTHSGSEVADVLSAEEKAAARRLKRRKKRKREKASAKPAAKKRGPRTVEYMCALCNEVYNSKCDYNPWWALSQHECPKCHKTQIPRVDISAPANAIEYHPALLAHADDNGAAAKAAAAAAAAAVAAEESDSCSEASDDNFDSLLSDSDGGDSDGSDLDALGSLSPAEIAENERFGEEYTGPKLSESEAGRLLVLISHASTCPCQHKQLQQRDTCRSIKWMLLHVRDCPGTTCSYDVCPFPWCRKIKHLMHHLVTCEQSETCAICSPKDLPPHLNRLRGLNGSRLKRYRERLVAQAKSMVKARASNLKGKSAVASGRSPVSTTRTTATKPPAKIVAPGSTVVKQVVLPQSLSPIEVGSSKESAAAACTTPRTTNKAPQVVAPTAVKSTEPIVKVAVPSHPQVESSTLHEKKPSLETLVEVK